MASPSVKHTGGIAQGALSVAFLVAMATMPVRAEDGPPLFARLSGSWNGTGTITMSSGDKERIRCRVDYTVAGAGKKLQQIMRCASDSYNFDVKADLEYSNGNVAGEWVATNYNNMTGEVTGQVDQTKIAAKVRGSGLVVNLVVSATASGQSINLVSEGTKIAGMNVTLAKGK